MDGQLVLKMNVCKDDCMDGKKEWMYGWRIDRQLHEKMEGWIVG